MGYEALEVSDWIRLDFQVGTATVDFTGRFCARFVVRMLLALYYLYVVFSRNKKLFFE